MHARSASSGSLSWQATWARTSSDRFPVKRLPKLHFLSVRQRLQRPNAALRNSDLPTRNHRSVVVQRPTCALDLHYLLSFYGDDSKLEPQRMLGAVVRRISRFDAAGPVEPWMTTIGHGPASVPIRASFER